MNTRTKKVAEKFSGFIMIKQLFIRTIAIVLPIVLSLSAVLYSYRTATTYSYDKLAESHYLKLKAGVFRAIADKKAPEQFVFRGAKGPSAFPPPIDVSLSEDIQATVFHKTLRRRNHRPQSVTVIDVQHAKSNRIYSLREINGKVFETIQSWSE